MATQKTLAEQFEDSLKKMTQTGNIVDDLFDRGYALEEVKAAMFEARLGVRDTLRNLDKTGILNRDQSAALLEMYPERKRGEGAEGDDDTAKGA